MPSAIITSKGRITIPRKVRDALRLGAGDRVEFVEVDDGVFQILAASRDVRELKGLIGRPGKAISVADMRKAVSRRPGR